YKEANYDWPNSTPAPYLFVKKDGDITMVLNPDYKGKNVPAVQWYAADRLSEAQGQVSLIDLYAKASEPGMSRILDAIEAGRIEDSVRVEQPQQINLAINKENEYSLESIAMVPAVKEKLPLMPVEQFNFVPAGYDTAVESLNAVQAVQKKFQEITRDVNLSAESSPRQVLEWMTQAINETPEGAGVFISIDMNADKLRSSDGTYYLGDDAKRFGEEQKDGFVRYQMAIEYYQLLATDYSRLIAIERVFGQGHDEAWQGAFANTALEEINLARDNRFASLSMNNMAQWVNQAATEAGPVFQGSEFLHNAKTGSEIRVLRGTLEGAIRRKSLETGGKTKAAQYPESSLRSLLTYEPVHTGMGTSGFRGRVDNMRDIEPYAISTGFVEWLAIRGQPHQKMALAGDLRDSSPDFMAAALKAYKDLGVEVVFLGKMSTPNMAYYCKMYGIAGIMITGSHTEGKYN
ncbi:MAG: hypothetical protein AAB296_06075, partial [Candidatus Desantisbacteria bacterium]